MNQDETREMREGQYNLIRSLASHLSSSRRVFALITGGVGLNRLWTFLKSRERSRVRLDEHMLNRENALWREIGELKAQVHALEVKLATDAKLRDWLVDEVSNCRLTLLLTMGEVNAECVNQAKPPRYDLREEARQLRLRTPPAV